MSVAEIKASERFIKAMGPMVHDEEKMHKVMLFIQSMRNESLELPTISYEELNECMPLDSAFENLHDNVNKAYNM